MTSIAVARAPAFAHPRPSTGIIVLAVVATGLTMAFGDALPWAMAYPEAWEIRVDRAISRTMTWLLKEADLGLFTFK